MLQNDFCRAKVLSLWKWTLPTNQSVEKKWSNDPMAGVRFRKFSSMIIMSVGVMIFMRWNVEESLTRCYSHRDESCGPAIMRV
jgi:hypothetical protein